ncbi:DUF5712 family protein [Spirosoma lituiforme]
MFTNLSSPIKGANSGSCQRLADYLEKENNQLAPHQREYFFLAHSDKVSGLDVVPALTKKEPPRGLNQVRTGYIPSPSTPAKKNSLILVTIPRNYGSSPGA